MEEKKAGRPVRKGTLSREDRDHLADAARLLTLAVQAWDRGMSSAMDLARAAATSLAKVRIPTMSEQRRLHRPRPPDYKV